MQFSTVTLLRGWPCGGGSVTGDVVVVVFVVGVVVVGVVVVVVVVLVEVWVLEVEDPQVCGCASPEAAGMTPNTPPSEAAIANAVERRISFLGVMVSLWSWLGLSTPSAWWLSATEWLSLRGC
jgi:hypothetical protein